jgi:hypothetical protein
MPGAGSGLTAAGQGRPAAPVKGKRMLIFDPVIKLLGHRTRLGEARCL